MICKRILDFFASLVGLILLSPLLLLTALLIRFKLGTPVLFRQQRPGLHCRPCYVYKFCTMIDERGADGNLLPDHVRLTPFGKLLAS